MKILVTGGNGYIGSHVVKRLLDLGHDVIACDVQFDNVDKRAQRVEFNIFVSDGDVYQKLNCPDSCLHLAWRNGFVHNAPSHIGDLSDHYRFLTNMIEGGLKHLAVMGSMHEVGYWEGMIEENTPCNPLSQYGIAKDALRRSMMLYCKEHGVTLQWLRGFYIFGDDERNHSIFTKLLQADSRGEKLFPFTTGKTKYDFLSVEELSIQIACAVTQTEVTGVINCCSGQPVSLSEKIQTYIKEKQLKIQLDYGKYPDRPYDSPVIYGSPTKIEQIMKKYNNIYVGY